MTQDHPRYLEWIVGTWEPVWRKLDGEATIDRTQRAYSDAAWSLVSSDTPDAKPTSAIGWKIDISKNSDGSIFYSGEGQPGWTTYAKRPDVKPVFFWEGYPTSLPKVAATIRKIRNHAEGNSENIIEELRQSPEKLGTYLLSNISHHLEKFLLKGLGYILENPSNNTTLEVINGYLGETTPWIQIKNWEKIYKVVTRGPYKYSKWRHCWSIFIDDSGKIRNDFFEAKNFKLLPEWESYFKAQICLDEINYSQLSWDHIALLGRVNQILESLSLLMQEKQSWK